MKNNCPGVILARLLLSGLLVAQSVWADSLDVWTPQYSGLPLGSGRTFQAVTFGNGIFVAVGDNLVATSSDGTNWSCRTSITPTTYSARGTTTNDLNAIAYGNGRFVAIGNIEPGSGPIITPVIVTSTDGTNWFGVEANPANWFGLFYPVFQGLQRVAFGNGLFFVGGGDGLMMTSADGLNWAGHATPSVNNATGVAYGNGVYAALTSDQNGFNSILTSSDGTNWTDHPTPANFLNCIAYGNGVFVLGGESGAQTIFSSTDALNWVVSAPAQDPTVQSDFFSWAMAYGNGQFLAVSEDSPWIISASNNIPSGSRSLSWVVRYGYPYTSLNYDLRGLAYGNGIWVAVGQGSGSDDPGILT